MMQFAKACLIRESDSEIETDPDVPQIPSPVLVELVPDCWV